MQLSRAATCVAAAFLVARAPLAAGAQPAPPVQPVQPVQPAPRAPDLDTLVARAVAASPAVRAAAARVEAARARVGPAAARPDPMLMAGVQNLPVVSPGLDDEMTMAMVGVGQTLVRPGKRALRRRVAEREADVARAELARVRLEVARDVRVAYYELAYLDRALALVERSRDVLVDLVRVAEARYGSGAGLGALGAGSSSAEMANAGRSAPTLAGVGGAGAASMGGAAAGMAATASGAVASMRGAASAMSGGAGAMRSSTAPVLGGAMPGAMPGAAAGPSGAVSSTMPGAARGGMPAAMPGGMGAAMPAAGALQEVMRVRVDAARLGEDASALREERLAVLARLNAARSAPIEAPLDSAALPPRLVRAAVADAADGVRFLSAALGARAAGSPLPSLATLLDRAARDCPTLRVHEAAIAAQEARAELARRERAPDVDVSLQYGVRPRHPDMVSATVSLPLPVQRRRVQDQAAAAARAELAAAESEHHAQLARQNAEIARVAGEAERARTQLALLRAAALPQAHAALDAGLAAYRAGRGGLGAVLDARGALLAQEGAYWRALSDFARAVAELELLVGGEVLP
jgi:outer membrane protein TolC